VPSCDLPRAVDAGRSPWLVALFFVPLVNCVLMLVLSALPSRPPAPRPEPGEPVVPTARAIGLSLLASVGVGLLLVAVCTLVLRGYGAALFLGVPFLMGVVGAFVVNRDEPRPLGVTLRIAAMTIVIAGVGLLLFALEGAICVVMGVPLALPIALAGAVVGRKIALDAPGTASHASPVVLALPALAALETQGPPPALREVVSVVEVDAPPEPVRRHGVTFSEVPEPPRGLFRLGDRLPGASSHRRRRRRRSAPLRVLHRRVRGADHGLGGAATAVVRRHRAGPGARRADALPLDPPPHLDGAFRARRGEFRLVALPGGRTRLAGSTWYELRMAPEPYWWFWSDALVHVKRLAEGERPG